MDAMAFPLETDRNRTTVATRAGETLRLRYVPGSPPAPPRVRVEQVPASVVLGARLKVRKDLGANGAG